MILAKIHSQLSIQNTSLEQSPQPANGSPAQSAQSDKPVLRLKRVTEDGDPGLVRNTTTKFTGLKRTASLVARFFEGSVAESRYNYKLFVDTIVAQLARNVANDQPQAFGLTDAEAGIALAVLAIAMLSDDDDSAPADTKSSPKSTADMLTFQAQSLCHAETGSPSLQLIQLRLLLTSYLLLSGRFNGAWYMSGQAHCMILMLGLHTDMSPDRNVPQESSYIHQHVERRVFWAAYKLDIQMDAVYTLPLRFHIADITQHMCDEIDDEDVTADGPLANENRDSYMAYGIASANLAQAIEKTSRMVYPARGVGPNVQRAIATELVPELQTWYENAPVFLLEHKPGDLREPLRQQTIQLRLTYNYAVIILHFPLSPEAPEKPVVIKAMTKIFGLVDTLSREQKT